MTIVCSSSARRATRSVLAAFATALCTTSSLVSVASAQAPPPPTPFPGTYQLINVNGAWGHIGCFNTDTGSGWRCWNHWQGAGARSIDQSGNVVFTWQTEGASVSSSPGRAYAVQVGSNNGNATATIEPGMFGTLRALGPMNFAAVLVYFKSVMPTEMHPQLTANLAAIEAEAIRRGLVAADGTITPANFFRVGQAYGLADDIRQMGSNGGKITMAQVLAELPSGTTQAGRDRVIAQLRPDANGMVDANRAATVMGNFWYARRDYNVALEMAEVAAVSTDARAIMVYSKNGTARLTNHADVYAEGLRARGLSSSAGEVATSPVGLQIAVASHLTNHGTVTVRGQESFGVRVGTVGGSAALTNHGTVVVEGALARGLSAGTGAGSGTTYSGDATLTNHGDVSAIGRDTRAISAGADGGNVTVVNSGNLDVRSIENGFNARGIRAASIDHGNVSVTNSGRITMDASDDKGIEALVARRTSSPTAPTNPGDVTVQNDGTITMRRGHSVGIAANSEVGGDVSVTNNGRIFARELGSFGIIAASANATGTISVTNGVDGNIRGGAGIVVAPGAPPEAAGIMVAGGAQRTVTNYGTISSENGVAIASYEGINNGVTYGGAATTVNNYGRIDGSVNLGSGLGTLNNHGRFFMGEQVNLGASPTSAGGTFTNSGYASVGRVNNVATTVVLGNFVLAAGGTLVIDINGQSLAQRSDQLLATGTAAINGTIRANVMSGPNGVGDLFTVLSAINGVTLGSTARVTATAGFRFNIELANGGHDLRLRTTRMGTITAMAANASPAVMQTAQRLAAAEAAMGTGAASSTMRQVTDAVRLETDATAAAAAMNRLSPHSATAAQQSAQTSAGAFANAMMSCASAVGEGKFAKEEQCLYATAKYRELDRDATVTATGAREQSQEFMAGVQVRLQDNWRLGFALGHEQVSSRLNDQAQALGTTEGGRIVGGLVLKNQWGAWSGYLNLIGSHGTFDNARFVTPGVTATGEQTVASVGLKGRLAYTMDNGAWYVRPMIDIGTTRTSLSGYSETGAGAANLVVNGASVWQQAFTPAVEVGGQMAFGGSGIARPYARAGVSMLTGSSLVLTGNFADAPVGVAGFALSEKTDRTFFVAETGVQMLFGNGVGLKLNYEGMFARNTDQHTVGAKMTINY